MYSLYEFFCGCTLRKIPQGASGAGDGTDGGQGGAAAGCAGGTAAGASAHSNSTSSTGGAGPLLGNKQAARQAGAGPWRTQRATPMLRRWLWCTM